MKSVDSSDLGEPSPDAPQRGGARAMSFLDVIPYTLFRVLASPAHVRNVAVLERIFEEFFDDFAFAPKKTEVLQVIQEVLDHSDYRSLIDEDGSPTDTADHVVYNRLRDDGWIMEVVNRRTIEVYMPREAHALLSSLITLKEELRSTFRRSRA